MPQENPPLLDKTMNTTESTPRNLADVLASGLANIANNVKPDGSDISIDVPGMSATNVDDGFSELKGTLDYIGNVTVDDFNTSQTAVTTTANTWVECGSVSLVKGKYVITSAIRLDDAFTSVYNHALYKGSTALLQVRNTGVNGGGTSVTDILDVDATATYSVKVNTPIATKAFGFIKAIRIA